jgi:hypothetical protein
LGVDLKLFLVLEGGERDRRRRVRDSGVTEVRGQAITSRLAMLSETIFEGRATRIAQVQRVNRRQPEQERPAGREEGQQNERQEDALRPEEGQDGSLRKDYLDWPRV